jgi:hypothetical protein
MRTRKAFRVWILMFACMLGSVVSAAHAVTVELVRTLPAVITGVNLGDYDLTADGTGPQMFVIFLSSLDETAARSGLRLRYTVHISGSDGTSERVYDGLSNYFTMNPGEMITITSNQFFERDAGNPLPHLVTTLFSMSDRDKQEIINRQRIPDGSLRFSITLESGGLPGGATKSFNCSILNTTRVTLLSPGASAGSGMLPVVTEQYPVFLWQSDLVPGIYGGGDVFEIRIWKARTGQSPAEVIGGPPTIRQRLDAFTFEYPRNGELLVPGATYYWQVTGFLKSTTTTLINSDIYRFRMARQPAPEVLEVIALLRMVYDEQEISQLLDYDAGVTIKINGRVVTVDALRQLILNIVAANNEITATTVR